MAREAGDASIWHFSMRACLLVRNRSRARPRDSAWRCPHCLVLSSWNSQPIASQCDRDQHRAVLVADSCCHLELECKTKQELSSLSGEVTEGVTEDAPSGPSAEIPVLVRASLPKSEARQVVSEAPFPISSQEIQPQDLSTHLSPLPPYFLSLSSRSHDLPFSFPTAGPPTLTHVPQYHHNSYLSKT